MGQIQMDHMKKCKEIIHSLSYTDVDFGKLTLKSAQYFSLYFLSKEISREKYPNKE